MYNLGIGRVRCGQIRSKLALTWPPQYWQAASSGPVQSIPSCDRPAPQDGHLSGSLTVLISDPSERWCPRCCSGMTNEGASIVKPRAICVATPEPALQTVKKMMITTITKMMGMIMNIIVNVPKMSPNISGKPRSNQISPYGLCFNCGQASRTYTFCDRNPSRLGVRNL